jgi:hypothetical protein
VGSSQSKPVASEFLAGHRVLLDAHNCYPYIDWWKDRIDRALSTGTPVAIEQDLYWYTDPKTQRSWSILAHGAPISGSEPTLKSHFFERVRPIVERALREGDHGNWPLITLNLDFKTEEPEHLKAIWNLLSEYKDWITTAPSGPNIHTVAPLNVKPLLVLTGESNAQKAVFYDQVRIGNPLLVFGATPTHNQDPNAEPAVLAPESADNYHRWWNNPWRVVEIEGQPDAGSWTDRDERRLNDLVKYAHQRGFWIRFYTLDGENVGDESANGWFHSYNFGSLDAARLRWRAAIRAGVDFVATDQYEDFARELHHDSSKSETISLTGKLNRSDYERLFERNFKVLPGTRQLKISLTYTGGDHGTVIDLGLRGPAGFRGWSGGGIQTIELGPTFASYGYLPGPIESGEWAVILGIPNIREGSTDSYAITVEQLEQERPAFPVLLHESRWFAGDFHSHSGHSDGRAQLSDGTRVKIPAHRVFDAAREAGLDFIALSDHNTTSHWTEVERLQPYYEHLLLLHAREVTTYNGHLNVFGEREFTDFRVGPDHTLTAVLDELRERGAFLSINHPALPDDERCMGCGWSSFDAETIRRVDAMEVVNGDTTEGELAGWPVWARMLNSGFHLTAIGGSDEHTADEKKDKSIGIPTSVVYASELSEPALLEGLRKGHAYVRTRGVNGPELLRFKAESPAGSWEMGDTVPNGVHEITLSANVLRASGQRIEWIRNGKILSTSTITADSSPTLKTQASPRDWFSIVLRDDRGPTLFSSAIYF